MPEYQFNVRHAVRVHASRERILQAIRESTFRDMQSLSTLLKVRGGFAHAHDADKCPYDMRILDAFVKSGYVLGSGDREVLAVGGANIRARRPLQLPDLQSFSQYNEPGGIKIAFDFTVDDAGGGWSAVTAETRILAVDTETRRSMGRYWRLIVPGSGLLRLQWLAAIKHRAEAAPLPASQP